AAAGDLIEQVAARLARGVERDAALVAVDREVPKRLAVEERRSPGPAVVAGPGPLDLDDLGAHVGEQHRAVGTRDRGGEVEDAHALEQGERRAPRLGQALGRNHAASFARRVANQIPAKINATPAP